MEEREQKGSLTGCTRRMGRVDKRREVQKGAFEAGGNRCGLLLFNTTGVPGVYSIVQ